MGNYDVAAIRDKMKKQMGRAKDPYEFKPPKAEEGKDTIYRFFVLPPFNVGEQLSTGLAQNSMDLCFVDSGAHFIENKMLGCPRCINGDECPICEQAFEQMNAIKELQINDELKKEKVRQVASALLPGQYRLVNIYFPDDQLGAVNPEALRGKVMWYATPKTVFDMWWQCISADGPGVDEFNPLPHGVFYDENAAYLFNLVAYKKNILNSYEKSKFLVTDRISKLPIARVGATMDPDQQAIQRILDMRHDLFSKRPEVKIEELRKVANNICNGPGANRGSGFDHDEEQMRSAQTKVQQQGFRPNVAASAPAQSPPPVTTQAPAQVAAPAAETLLGGEFPVMEATPTQAVQAPAAVAPAPTPEPVAAAPVAAAAAAFNAAASSSVDDDLEKLLADMS